MAKIAVVGGGPGGMMAALAAAGQGAQVTLWEKNEKLGKKLFITGKGRCNVTNDADISDFFMQVRRNAKFLYSAFYGFDNRALMAWFEQAGVPLKVERGGRVFPVSDKSSDVIRSLERGLKNAGVEIRLNAQVQGLLLDEDGAERRVKGLRAAGKPYPCDGVILATGGVSYPRTGSTGDGYRFAQKVGHTLCLPSATLIPIDTVEDWPGTLAGLTLKNVRLRVVQRGKICYDDLGEMIFTHTGVSGPLVLSGSSCCDGDRDVKLEIDLKPGLDDGQLNARLQRDFDKYAKKQLANVLQDIMPRRLIDVVVSLSGVSPALNGAEIGKADRKRLAELLKALPMTVERFRPVDEAIVTRGGVSCREVNASSMESKKVKGLYFAGEMLDVDATTGGYNLQIAFSTGRLAGLCAGWKGDADSWNDTP